MVDEGGSTKNARRKSGKLNYFYLNGKLHKSLHINRGADRIITWCYPDKCRVAYTYSDVKKNKRPAFSSDEAAEMLNRRRLALERAILNGDIEEPQHTYGLTTTMRKHSYKWSEEDIIRAHAHFSTVHQGRPRNDGLVTPKPMPSLRELRAMMRQEHILYVKGEDGEFRPVWRAQDFD